MWKRCGDMGIKPRVVGQLCMCITSLVSVHNYVYEDEVMRCVHIMHVYVWHGVCLHNNYVYEYLNQLSICCNTCTINFLHINSHYTAYFLQLNINFTSNTCFVCCNLTFETGSFRSCC